jgi:hypothetical protein
VHSCEDFDEIDLEPSEREPEEQSELWRPRPAKKRKKRRRRNSGELDPHNLRHNQFIHISSSSSKASPGNSVFQDIMPNPTYSLKGVVSLKCEVGDTWITSGIHLLLSMVQFKNFLVNKEFGRLEEGSGYLDKMECLAKSMWAKEKGTLSPLGLITYVQYRFPSGRRDHFPQTFLIDFLQTFGNKTLIRGTAALNLTYQKLLANT